MSKISLSPDASGTGIFTIASPNSNTNRTLTLPDDTGTIVTNSGNQAGSFTTLNTSGAVVFNDAGADVDFRVEGDTEANLLFVDAGNDRVGIGVNNPSSRLQVSAPSSDLITEFGNISVLSNDSQAADKGGSVGFGGVYQNSDIAQWAGIRGAKENGTFGNFAGYLSFFTRPAGGSTTERMRIDSSGNVGIGVTPSAWQTTFGSTALQFLGSSIYGYRDTNLIASQNAYYDGSWKYYASSIAASQYNMGSGVHKWNIAPSGTAGNAISFTQAMTLDASGNLLVGTTSNYGDRRLDLRGSANNFVQSITNTGAGPAGLQIHYSTAAPNTGGAAFIYCHDSATVRMTANSNGGISNYSANNVNLSDRREKTNFAPAKNYLNTICAIPVQTFNYIDQNLEEDDGLTLGVVAQDVQEVAPELVMESNWGTEEEPKMRLSIYQTDLQYALMKCIQELKAELDTVKAELATLKG